MRLLTGPTVSASSITRSLEHQKGTWFMSPDPLPFSTLTDWTNTNSTFREEPPKMVTFHGNWNSPCNIDDPEWNPAASRETVESISMTSPGHPGVLKRRRRRRPTFEIGPHMMINVENQLYSEMAESQGSQSTSMTPAKSFRTLWEFAPGSEAFGNPEMSFLCWGLTQAISCMRRKICNLRWLPLAVKRKWSLGLVEVSSQSTVKIRSRNHGNHRKLREETGTSKCGASGGPAFHEFANYVILDPREETSTASIDSCCGAWSRVYLRSARKTLPKSRRCTQFRDMTSRRWQLFQEND